MKKQWLTAGLLIVLDQIIKVLIWQFAMEERISIIPNVLRFEPYQNTNLNWLASMADIVMPVFLMVVIQLCAASAITLFYRFQSYKSSGTGKWLSVAFCFLLAGIGCSFIDVVCWGGSLDYIGLFNWFIFDLKDVFLNVGWISIVIWYLSGEYRIKNKDNISFKSWVVKGCKME